MSDRPELKNWVFALIIGGGIVGFSVLIFVLSYLRLHSS